MQFFDPARPRLANGLPVWLGQAVPTALPIALPPISFFPLANGFDVLVMLWTGSYARRDFGKEEFFQFITAWENSPEEALQQYFRKGVGEALSASALGF